ncbi:MULTISPECIES: 2'-5' RNA ligase family protein [Cryobacterium]|uniref:2'-5' RNA ligase family protein n=1 Tax=Cryobacterium zongtaii TaxID=1259217 RepID=A0A2S3ZH25_9MICO|nr:MULTISPECIES: 2'-5' RNA ligase family protein [Cryobacterium]POH63567.1 hypothetical protein C3B60_15715 [Cryobacterium zongtaii]POH66678.1 hypothetical protein C3B61_09015 [Cryobacterium zongtaii]TFC42094.1 hypothetical protein E3O57_15755 [Cryobacterium sp. TMN-39-2]
MPRLVVVLPVVPLRVGAGFAVAEWPLHVTVLAPFLTDADPGDVGHAIRLAVENQAPLTVVAGEDALFGRRHTIPVTMLLPHEGLTRLHRTLVDTLRPFAAAPDEPAFTGDGFRAHVTHKPPARLHPGQSLTLGQVALVDMLPRTHEAGRTVLAATSFAS